LPVDRDGDVPVGVQVAWALRTKIGEGLLPPGTRLPGLRELADATGVNVNTARAAYQRLEREGLVDSQQGTGTFVAAAARPSALSQVAVLAAAEARDHGVSARELAAALYVRPQPAARPRGGDLGRRKLLRGQITALETAACELEAQHALSVPVRPSRRWERDRGPRLLGLAELEATRIDLVRRLVAIQGAIDEKYDATSPGGSSPALKAQPAKPAKKPSSTTDRRPRSRLLRPGLADA
jgi:DNA-binding transcriptional regulator YhcF (GntR family)